MNPFADIKIYQEKKLSVFARKLQRAIIAKLIYVRIVKMEDFVISKMRQMILNAFVRFHIMANSVKVKFACPKLNSIKSTSFSDSSLLVLGSSPTMIIDTLGELNLFNPYWQILEPIQKFPSNYSFFVKYWIMS